MQTLPEDMPEVETAACFVNYADNIVLSSNNNSIRANGKFGSKNFFKIFSFPFLDGDSNNVLTDKNSIVVSKKLALAFFNTTENVIGKPINVGEGNFFITGVFEDFPHNSSLQFDFMLSYEYLKELYPESFSSWGNTGPRTFIVVKAQTDIAQFSAKIKNYVKEKSDNANTTLLIQKYSDTYLHNNYQNGKIHGGRILYVRLFVVIAFFILLIACINFMNLSTAIAFRRAKETGIKKAIGSSREKLIYQYLGESIFISKLAMLLAIVSVAILLPSFNHLTQKQLHIPHDRIFILSLLGINLLTGFVAGTYPAFYLSGFKSINILKGKFQSYLGELWTRKGLVVFQFTISVILIVSVLVVSKQVSFIQAESPGYNKENIVYFGADGAIQKQKEAFISEMKKIPGILSATTSDHNLIGHEHSTSLNWEGKSEEDNVSFEFAWVGYNMMETFGMKTVSGRSFSKDYGEETSKIILNETAVKAMGIDNPVGKMVNQWGQKKEIIGVVKDFHFESFYEKVKPLFFAFNPDETNIVIARIKAGTEKEIIGKLSELYQKFNPHFSFDYKFLDAEYNSQYQSEQRISALAKYFTGIAILISCLGLFGLATFTTERRRKEFGIRKVMGSDGLSIARLLSGEFIIMVLTAIFIALPISYLITNKWLESFAYKTELSWWVFALAGLLALGIALLTVSWQSWRAATRNPVEALRYE